MIRLNVFILVEEENIEHVINLAKELTFHTLNEEGCKAYDIFKSSTRKNVLMICETWATEESLTLHQNTKHYKHFKEHVKNITTIKVEKFIFSNDSNSIH